MKVGIALNMLCERGRPDDAVVGEHLSHADLARFREIALAMGHEPPPPIVLTNVCCAKSREEARERAMEYLARKWQSIDDHYHFSDGHLAAVRGYEAYGRMA